jgi:methylmalonyl-CoA mutase N-terminal domain/subunit
VRAARSASLDPGQFGERLSFFFACHSDFLEEVAKFRAARRLWARLMKETLGVENPKAQHLRFHVQTGGVTLTAQQPDNNVVRVALQALAAVLGGCQSLHTNGKDEALALPTEGAARLALRTQQVIAFESGVVDTVDPFGGSYAVEEKTDRLEEEARALIDRVESRGGALRAIEQGDIQRAIQESAYRFQKEVETGERVIVGVNRFTESEEEAPADILRIDPALEKAQVERVRALRARRAEGPWRAALDALESRARGGGNLVPSMVEAVLAWATVGEIAHRLRAVFGEHRRRSYCELDERGCRLQSQGGNSPMIPIGVSSPPEPPGAAPPAATHPRWWPPEAARTPRSCSVGGPRRATARRRTRGRPAGRSFEPYLSTARRRGHRARLPPADDLPHRGRRHLRA